LSEVTAKDLERACKVAKIAAVQSEYSPWSLEPETSGVLDDCRRNGISLVAYSPLGRGFLTGQIRSPDDVKADSRAAWPRFQPENFQKNFDVVEKLEKLAEKKNVKVSQLGLAWLRRQGRGTTVLPIFGTRSAVRVKENLESLEIQLSDEEDHEIREIVDAAASLDLGARYLGMMASLQLRDTPPEK
jgi:aryl-alcohol dehydrogenase-like predicted oxidoreductase